MSSVGLMCVDRHRKWISSWKINNLDFRAAFQNSAPFWRFNAIYNRVQRSHMFLFINCANAMVCIWVSYSVKRVLNIHHLQNKYKINWNRMHRMNEKQNINFIFILSKEAIFVAKQSHERNTTSADVNALWNFVRCCSHTPKVR